jgi:hypothetical protein
VSPEAFFQINTYAAEILYNSVAELSCPTENTTVIDICCGTGSIGLCLAKVLLNISAQFNVYSFFVISLNFTQSINHPGEFASQVFKQYPEEAVSGVYSYSIKTSYNQLLQSYFIDKE